MLLSVMIVTVAASLVSAQNNEEGVNPEVIGIPENFFGGDDLVDISQNGVPNNVERVDVTIDETLGGELEKHLYISNEFVRSGNNISALRDGLRERNETINENFLLAEHFWGLPSFEAVTETVETAPRLRPLHLSAFFPCKLSMYNCPVRWRYLWYFRDGIYACYVPWPKWQLIRYTECICEYCLAPFQHGTCQPSFYQVRNFWAVCIHREFHTVLWRRVTRLLPTNCRCRTC